MREDDDSENWKSVTDVSMLRLLVPWVSSQACSGKCHASERQTYGGAGSGSGGSGSGSGSGTLCGFFRRLYRGRGLRARLRGMVEL